ncbi:MAG: hypothetical protein K6G07_02175 [Lachnospiraceae bacterium]|nr:hypothetical protein [Lachnospiraceae bacterium]
MIARLVTAYASIRIGSFNLAVAGDATSWFSAGVFSFILYPIVMKQKYLI